MKTQSLPKTTNNFEMQLSYIHEFEQKAIYLSDVTVGNFYWAYK